MTLKKNRFKKFEIYKTHSQRLVIKVKFTLVYQREERKK